MQVFITHQAKKQYTKILTANRQRHKDKLDLLTTTPLAGKSLKGQLEGYYSLRSWPYRIIYQIDGKNQQVFVITIIHRQGAYK